MRSNLTKYYYSRVRRNSGFTPFKGLEKVSQVILGLDSSRTWKRNLLTFGWRFVFGLAFIVFIFTGNTPFDIFNNTIRALNGSTEIVNLYPSYARPDRMADDNAEGWWKTDNMKGIPELGPDASVIEFSDENSSFYAGGDFSVVLGDFKWLKEEMIAEPENEILQDEDIIDDNLLDMEISSTSAEKSTSTEIVDEQPADTENEIDNFLDESTEEATGTETILEDGSATADDEQPAEVIDNTDTEGGAEVLDNADDTTDSGNVEILNQDATQSENQPVEIVEESEVLDLNSADDSALENDGAGADGSVSWFDSIKNGFKAMTAQAQEFVNANIEKLEDFGEFKGAKLKISLAEPSYAEATEGEPSLTEATEGEPSLTEATEGEPLSSAGDTVADQIEVDNSASTTEDDTASQSTTTDVITDDFQASEAGQITIWYTLGETVIDTEAVGDDYLLWKKLDTVSGEDLSNALNGGYFTFDLDFLTSWSDVRQMQVKLTGASGEKETLIYIDSIWVEAEYERETELEKLKKRERWQSALDLLSRQIVFDPVKGGDLRFQYNKNTENLWDTLSEIMGVGNFWSDVNISAELIDSGGQLTGIPLNVIFEEDGQFLISLPEKTSALRPGRYSIRFHIIDNSGGVSEEFDIFQDFFWGIVAFNANKSSYLPDEEAYLQFAVLDEAGHTVCGADIDTVITKPNGEIVTLSTKTDEYTTKIYKNPDCGVDNITNVPDYYAHYKLGEAGTYNLLIKTTTASGEKSIEKEITVADTADFDVERFGPTRINPKADYVMELGISTAQDFTGDIIEVVPAKFKIKNYELRIKNSDDRDPFGGNYKYYEEMGENGEKKIVWQDVELQAGDVLNITYTFDAPDVSPELFLLGALSVGSDFVETRKWEIASDSFLKRAKTVQFMAGTYNGAAASGNSTNNDYTMTAFNWRLAETGVSIKSAYIVFESQFEAYNSTGLAYNGYKLGFDACEGSACADAFGIGSGQVLENNNNTLAYDETESNVARLMLDVASETELAAYTGNGVLMESQFGYNIKNSNTKVSIANASAVLFLTYTYDLDSPSLTNTVIYPLDSTYGTDSGTRQLAFGACTADSNCPTFSYNMEIPEWQGVATSTNRVGQWFKMYNNPDVTGATDVDSYLDIQNVNVDSSIFHFDEANTNNGGMPPMFFPEWASSGYVENQSQEVEFYASTTVTAGADNVLAGGEVVETYIASSSAAVKTRTVSFPMGTIVNGNSVVFNSKDATVFFPENGTATGTVSVKSAWVRLYSHNPGTATTTITLVTKTSSNASSSNYVYNYNGNDQVLRPTINIIHIIPSADYAELENANATAGKTVKVGLTYNSATFGGASAELMITYTYSSEGSGYLTNLNLFGGQTSGAPATSTLLATANSVFPENTGKTVYAAGLYASFLNSESDGAVSANVIYLDANLSDGTPVCTPAYRATPDSNNSYSEFIKDVKSALSTTDNTGYSACLTADDTVVTVDGAKMNSQLIYTYGWTNSPPTGAFNSASFRRDGSGTADLSVEIDDPDDQDTVRAKVEFATGTACVFTPAGHAILDETNENITADFGDPYISNMNDYQIGTADAYIKTASGSNSVDFDMSATNSLGAVEGDYCLRVTANDLNLDQTVPATSLLYVDTLPPTAPGALTLYHRTGTDLILNFGATTTETNFLEYKIFFKIFDGSDPTESSSVFSSTSDSHLFAKLLGGAATTTIPGLTASTTYSFAIWAYDTYGNKSSSTRVDITTNDPPTGSFNEADTKQKKDGTGRVDISIEADDPNDQDSLRAKIEFATGTSCIFSPSGDPALDENPSNVQADFGLPAITNANDYQIGTSGAWIHTAPGANTVSFDWLGRSDLPAANGTYCLRLTTNDGYDSQVTSATTTVTLDNVDPASTGSLTSGGATVNSITLVYATTSPASDTNPPSTNAYKIFYKQGTTGAALTDTEIDNANLNYYSYNGATSTTVGGLLENTWYVFNIWSFDDYGNMTTSTEVAIKTNATINNTSFAISDALSDGFDTNIVVSGNEEWNFRVVVTETNGWQVIASTTLRLADKNDEMSPFEDLVFYWDQSANAFYEIGSDASTAVSLANTSVANCSDTQCILDFNIIFNKTFASTSREYAAELKSVNDIGITVVDSYPDFYQVRFPILDQKHYRIRNDDGGE